MDEDLLFLCFINKMGQDIDKKIAYEFLFSTAEQLNDVWGQNWNVKPAGICGDIPPEDSTYDKVKLLKTDVVLDLAQDNMCYSMQDCIDGGIALGIENLSAPDAEYPENGRIIFHFGENIKDVEYKLAKRNLIMGWV